MAGALKLTYSGTDIVLSPLSAYQPDHNVDSGLIKKIGSLGALFIYKKFTTAKVNHRFEFNNVNKADADNLNIWWQNGYTITYTPDIDIPGTTYQVKLINDVLPFDWMPNTPPDSKFQGSLMIRRI